jgi:predicted ATPase
VEVISACSRATVILFLDDLQWADEFPLSALEQIMVMPNQGKRFFFVGCYRDDEVTDNHPFKKVIDKASENGVRLTKIQLECMDKNSVNRIVSELLCLSPRLVKSLSEIVYCKTKGNPLFFSRLLMSLNRDGLLNLSLSRRRWVWDEELIQSRQLPDDVASLLSSGISKLSLEVQEALQVLSCFGSIEEKELSILEKNLGLQLLFPLEVAVDEGFVCKNKAKYNFAHDRIQEAVYCLMPLNNRRRDHMRYGVSSVKKAMLSVRGTLFEILCTCVF